MRLKSPRLLDSRETVFYDKKGKDKTSSPEYNIYVINWLMCRENIRKAAKTEKFFYYLHELYVTKHFSHSSVKFQPALWIKEYSKKTSV